MTDCKKLAWQCRRGMKELDELLARYLRNCYPDAAPTRQCRFEQLLELEDPELASLVLGGAEAGDPEMEDVIAEIRRHDPR